MNDQPTSSQGSVSLGIGLLLVGGFFWAFSFAIKVPALSGNADPGPRAVPQALGLLVLVGGVVELGSAARNWSQKGLRLPRLSSGAVGPDHKKVIVFTGILSVYVLTVPFAFYTSTIVFAALTLRYLGARWWSAAAIGGGIATVVWALFVKMFLVPLPTLVDLLPSLFRGP